MQLNARDVYGVLKGKGVTALHHANTVVTSLTFIKAGGLLSRGAVAKSGGIQTSQWTDKVDKEYGVWDDVFVDGIDIHARSSHANKYGPVLFKLDLELLNWSELPPLWVTRDNPYKWRSSDKPEDRYYQSVKEFESQYQYGDFAKMMTLRSSPSPIPFDSFLQTVDLDDPGRDLAGKSLYTVAETALGSALQSGSRSLVDKLRKRVCSSSCKCAADYRSMAASDLRRHFFPTLGP